ncbi:MAG: hypothetical protein IJW54_03250 [Clostridia bacterium]|nr:hypothetical protein [Clostridia bacterium]
MKIIGIIFIIFASLFATVCYEKKLKIKIIRLEALFDFISYMETQISLFSLPINSIFSNYKLNTELIYKIKEKKYEDFYVYDEDFSVKVINFFENIGKGYKDQQLKSCKAFADILNKELVSQKSDIKNKIKIFRTMAFFLSACIIIFIV